MAPGPRMVITVLGSELLDHTITLGLIQPPYIHTSRTFIARKAESGPASAGLYFQFLEQDLVLTQQIFGER